MTRRALNIAPRIERLLHSIAPLTTEQLAGAVGVSHSAAHSAVSELHECGVIERVPACPRYGVRRREGRRPQAWRIQAGR